MERRSLLSLVTPSPRTVYRVSCPALPLQTAAARQCVACTWRQRLSEGTDPKEKRRRWEKEWQRGPQEERPDCRPSLRSGSVLQASSSKLAQSSGTGRGSCRAGLGSATIMVEVSRVMSPVHASSSHTAPITVCWASAASAATVLTPTIALSYCGPSFPGVASIPPWLGWPRPSVVANVAGNAALVGWLLQSALAVPQQRGMNQSNRSTGKFHSPDSSVLPTAAHFLALFTPPSPPPHPTLFIH